LLLPGFMLRILFLRSKISQAVFIQCFPSAFSLLNMGLNADQGVRIVRKFIKSTVNKSLPGHLYAHQQPPSSHCTLSHHMTMSTGVSKSVDQWLWQVLSTEGTRGTGGYSHSLRCFSQNAMVSAACAFAMPMHVSSSCVGALHPLRLWILAWCMSHPPSQQDWEWVHQNSIV